MQQDKQPEDAEMHAGMSRRQFFQATGIVAIGIGFQACATQKPAEKRFLEFGALPQEALPTAGYLLVDTRKCQGCLTCMLACSLVHEGEVNLSLARIQISQDPFGKYPHDIRLSLCRQCLEPACVQACPTGALHIDPSNGNLRRVDAAKCIGCQACLGACPYIPGRMIWNVKTGQAQKCDLCLDTPYWNEKGGPGGKQACVSACPLRAIVFTDKIPIQTGAYGYETDLRGASWARTGYPAD